MKTLDVVDQNVLSAYNKGSEQEREFLKRLFPNQDFNQKITDRVKTYEDACEIKGIQPMSIGQFNIFPESQREYLFCLHQDDIINEVLNEGWEADFSKGDAKNYPYFYWDVEKAGGPGFSYYDCICDCSNSYVGARRTFKTPELAKYSGTQFLHIHSVIHSKRTK